MECPKGWNVAILAQFSTKALLELGKIMVLEQKNIRKNHSQLQTANCTLQEVSMSYVYGVKQH